MKSFNKFFLLIIMGGVILTSCNKTETSPVNSINLQTASDAELEQQIINFRTTMLDSRKSATEGEMNFGDAVFLMEAAFNYSNGFAYLDYKTTKTDTAILQIEHGALSEISMDKLSELFKNVNNAIFQHFTDFEGENKHLLYVDLNIQTNNAGFELYVMPTFGEVNSQKSDGTGSSNLSPVFGTATPFGSNDYWSIISGFGTCGSASGIVPYSANRDAGTELNIKINANKYIRPMYYYWSDVTTVGSIYPQDYPNTFTLDAASNYKEYLLPNECETNANYHNCLTPSEMNFHYNGGMYIVNVNKPSGKYFMGCQLFADGISSSIDYPIWYFVMFSYIKYGIPKEAKLNPCDLFEL
jgi:hypothetical protein